MKTIFRLSLILIVSLCFYSCSKGKHVPIVTTSGIASITKNSAKSGGIIISDCGYPISAKGVCWSKEPVPTVKGSKTNDGIGFTAFTSEIIQLEMNTVYYVRAYATNSSGTGYGSELSFKTLECMYCMQVTYENGVVIAQGPSQEYCGAALVAVKDMPEVRVGKVTYKWVCN